MRIPPRGPGNTGGAKGADGAKGSGKAQGTGKAQGSSFAQKIGATQTATDDQSHMQSAMMQELAQLAAELEAGKATKEEASRRFVGLVIRRKFGKQKGKGAETMEEAVSDMVEADPQFVSKLQSQLKRIARS